MKDEYGSQRAAKNSEVELGSPRWDKVELPFYGDVSLGNGTQYKFGIFKTPGKRLFIGIENNSCYTFSNWCHFTYAREKLGLKFEGDARNAADFINAQLDKTLITEEQGKYEDKLCN